MCRPCPLARASGGREEQTDGDGDGAPAGEARTASGRPARKTLERLPVVPADVDGHVEAAD